MRRRIITSAFMFSFQIEKKNLIVLLIINETAVVK